MRRFAGATAAISMLLLTAAHAQDVTMEVTSATIGAGSTGQISVVLNAGSNDVAGTENELSWDSGLLEVDNCVVNAAIDKNLQQTSSEGFFKGIIINFSDLSPIADGSVLYTCDVTVNATTEPGEYEVTCSAPGSSDPVGGDLDTDCVNSTITVPEEPQVLLSLNMIETVPGGTAALEVSLELLKDVEVAGTENVLLWDPAELTIDNCEVNEAIDKSLQSTTGPGRFKGIIINFSDLSPIDDGSLLYSCDVGLGAGTAAATTSGQTGSFEIVCDEPGTSDPLGNSLITICNNTTVNVVEPPTPTPTVTPTHTQPTVEPTVEPTPDVTATFTATNTPIDTATNTPRPRVDDDACAVVAPQDASMGWMLLLPMAAMLWLRRRTR